MTVTRLTHIAWYVTPRFYLQIMYFWKHLFNEKCFFITLKALYPDLEKERFSKENYGRWDFNEIRNFIFKNIKMYRASSTCMQTLQRKTRTEKLKYKEMIPMIESELWAYHFWHKFRNPIPTSNSKTFLRLKFKLLGIQIKRIVLVRQKLF